MGKINCGGFELGDGLVVENGILKKVGTNTSEVSKLIGCGGFKIGEGLTFENGKLSCSGGGYPEPEGDVTIQTNGTYDVKDKATAIVDVPQPSGNKAITENGTHNVKDYAYAVVNVSGYPEPSGEFTIFTSGYYDCKDYANVDVKIDEMDSDYTEAEDTNSIQFMNSLENLNFIVVGMTSQGVQLIYHVDNFEFSICNGQNTIDTIYDVDVLSDGVILLTSGYNFIVGETYYLYSWESPYNDW